VCHVHDWLELTTGAAAVTQARLLVREHAAQAGFRDDGGVAELLTSELVMNAVVQGASAAVCIRVRASSPELSVEVRDGSAGLPHRRRPDGERGGYGLQLVAALASDWGFELEDGGKRVWFRLRSE